MTTNNPIDTFNDLQPTLDQPSTPIKRPRGRPRKVIMPSNTIDPQSLSNALSKPSTTDPSPSKSSSKSSKPSKSYSKAIKQALNFYTLPPISLDNPLEVKGRIDWYFLECASKDIRPSLPSLSLSLGVSRQTFMKWVAGTSRPNLQSISQKALSLLEVIWADEHAHGLNPASSIFIAKNDFGYKDTSEVVVAAHVEQKTREQLIEESKYLPGLPPDGAQKEPPLKGDGTVD